MRLNARVARVAAMLKAKAAAAAKERVAAESETVSIGSRCASTCIQ